VRETRRTVTTGTDEATRHATSSHTCEILRGVNRGDMINAGTMWSCRFNAREIRAPAVVVVVVRFVIETSRVCCADCQNIRSRVELETRHRSINGSEEVRSRYDS
jgi:hypothetical protein